MRLRPSLSGSGEGRTKHWMVNRNGFLVEASGPARRPACNASGRAVKRAVAPKAVKRARLALSPIDNLQYSVERSIATSLRSGRRKKGRAPVFRHGSCAINHRAREAAARCRNL